MAFLDCDDALETGALQAVRTALEKHPEVDYLFTDRIDVDETGKTVRVARYGGYDNLHFTQQDNIAADLIDGMVASHLKVIRRSVYQAVGGCDAIFSGVQDWELALRIAQAHELYYLSAPCIDIEFTAALSPAAITYRNCVKQIRYAKSIWKDRVIYIPMRDRHGYFKHMTYRCR